MRVATMLLAMVLFAGAAYADEIMPQTIDTPTNLTPPDNAFYCQLPNVGWNAFNASNAFNSEMADDIPSAYNGMTITHVTFYHAQWGGGYTAPAEVVVNFYNEDCPPPLSPYLSFTVPWGALEQTMVYQGSWFVNEIKIPLPEPVLIVTPMSIGGLVNVGWGTNPPYNGLCVTDEYNIAGCGEGYWAGDYWGYPRWSPFSWYWGAPFDVAYCLSYKVETPTETSTWGKIKSMY